MREYTYKNVSHVISGVFSKEKYVMAASTCAMHVITCAWPTVAIALFVTRFAKKGSYTCTFSRHTLSSFVSHVCLILLKLEQSAFTQADIHKCSVHGL